MHNQRANVGNQNASPPGNVVNNRFSYNGCRWCQLRSLAFCSAFKEEDLVEIERISRYVRLQPGETVFYERAPAEYAYILYTGCVKLTKDLPDGRREIVGFQLPSDFLGLVHDGLYACTAEAIGESTLCRVAWKDFQGMFAHHPSAEDSFMRLISDELYNAMGQMLLLGRMTATEKLINFLLDFSRRSKRIGLSGTHLKLPMARPEIADYLGLTTESVSRLFTRLREDGLVDIPDRHHVILKDINRLRALLEEDETILKRYGKTHGSKGGSISALPHG